MPVRLRLQRHGRKKLPFYHIVAADSRSPRDGRCLEKVGTYNPIPNKNGVKEVALKTDRVRYWLGVGAQTNPTVGRLLGQAGIVPAFPQQFRNAKSVPKDQRSFSTSSISIPQFLPTDSPIDILARYNLGTTTRAA
jgi:small subunit ribosomal protein S16